VPKTNTLAYFDGALMKMKFFYYIDTRGCIQNTSFGPNKLERYITLGWKRLTRKKHSNLMGAFISFEENEVL
jgi:hypothetical protein